MPPQRRSQGPAPPHQPTPPRASNRQRQPTARAAAAPKDRGRGVVGGDQAPPPPPPPPPAPLPNNGPATDGGGRGAAADIPTPPLPTMWSRRVGPTSTISKRKQQERQVEDRIAGKTKPTVHDPRSAAAKEGLFGAAARGPAGDAARRREYEANKRMLDARARVEVRREEEQREWAKDVKKYGEVEALRRLHEERAAQKELDQLPSSKLEELRIEEEHGDSKIEVKVGLRVSKRLEWAHTAVIQAVSEFDI